MKKDKEWESERDRQIDRQTGRQREGERRRGKRERERTVKEIQSNLKWGAIFENAQLTAERWTKRKEVRDSLSVNLYNTNWKTIYKHFIHKTQHIAKNVGYNDKLLLVGSLFPLSHQEYTWGFFLWLHPLPQCLPCTQPRNENIVVNTIQQTHAHTYLQRDSGLCLSSCLPQDLCHCRYQGLSPLHGRRTRTRSRREQTEKKIFAIRKGKLQLTCTFINTYLLSVQKHSWIKI